MRATGKQPRKALPKEAQNMPNKSRTIPAAPRGVMLSLVDGGANRADVFLNDQPVASVYRADGNWNVKSPEGIELFAPMPHTLVQKGREQPIPLGVVLNSVRQHYCT